MRYIIKLMSLVLFIGLHVNASESLSTKDKAYNMGLEGVEFSAVENLSSAEVGAWARGLAVRQKAKQAEQDSARLDVLLACGFYQELCNTQERAALMQQMNDADRQRELREERNFQAIREAAQRPDTIFGAQSRQAAAAFERQLAQIRADDEQRLQVSKQQPAQPIVAVATKQDQTSAKPVSALWLSMQQKTPQLYNNDRSDNDSENA